MKKASAQLKEIPALKHIYIKADMAKAEKSELTRLYKIKEKMEEEEEENSDRTFEIKNGKLYVDNNVIDRVNTEKTYFL